MMRRSRSVSSMSCTMRSARLVPQGSWLVPAGTVRSAVASAVPCPVAVTVPSPRGSMTVQRSGSMPLEKSSDTKGPACCAELGPIRVRSNDSAARITSSRFRLPVRRPIGAQHVLR